MAQPAVLAYHFPPERLGRLRTLCAVEKLRLHPIQPAEYGARIGMLAGILPPSAAAAEEDEAPAAAMRVHCGLTAVELARVLRALRAAGLAPGVLKAVLTPTNAAWTAPQLCRALLREREAMGRL